LLAGVLGYEMVDRFEVIGPRREDPCDDDDLDLVLIGAAVDYEAGGRVRVVTRGLPWERRADVDARHDELLERLARREKIERGAPPSSPLVLAPGHSDFEARNYVAAVGAVHEAIAAGDVFQTVLARSFEMECRASAAELAAAFAELEPDADTYCLDLRHGALVGASPELFVDVAGGADDSVVVRPIAGTCARPLRADGTRCRDADARAAAALQSSAKERAEHAMLVDLARNDVARVSRAGTTVVERPFVVEAQRHVLHLVSSVRGRRRPGLDALHVWRAVANVGTLTGAPKVRAMELLRAIEPIGRGSYGGAVGMLDGDGAFRSCIAIRGVRLRGGRALARAGAGIVRASVAELELAETEQKLATAREAVALANARAGGAS
jgi:anthranilate synthase component 1